MGHFAAHLDVRPHFMKRTLHLLSVLALMIIFGAFIGCGRSDISGEPKTQWVDPHKLEPGPIRNASLSPTQMERVQRLQKVFSDVDPSPVDKWVDDFKRDANPESEIAIYESMATAFEGFTTNKNLSLDAKNDVYQVVLLRSAAPEEEVLKHLKLKILTEENAKEIMSLYTAKPEPIKVVSP